MKIESVYTLKSPLSHIGESESTASFLNTVRILNAGEPQEVFAYTGNALRGAWRDCGAKFLLNKLGVKANKKMFHILFAGGNLSGDQKNDTEQARKYRSLLPFISVLGAGIGNQILAGKLVQSFAYPVCKETSELVPKDIPAINYAATKNSWKQLTGSIQFTRKDDLKDVNLAEYLQDEAESTESETMQMRYEAEYLVPGTQLYHVAYLDRCSDIDYGAFVSCVYEWSKNPVLGGMSGKGFGNTELNMTADGIPFLQVGKNGIKIEAKAAGYLKKYEEYLEEHKEEIIEMVV